MQNNFIIQLATAEEVDFISSKIKEYTAKNIPLRKDQVVESICRVIKDSAGNVIAGVVATLLPWTDLIIHGMWASEDLVEDELKVKLLNEIERELKEKGGHVAMHETFDVKTADFYAKNGYEVYGTLDEYPAECKAYYLKRIF